MLVENVNSGLAYAYNRKRNSKISWTGWVIGVGYV